MLRTAWVFAVVVGALTHLAGCGQNSAKSLLTNGIGTDIYVSDTGQRADHLEQYFGLMCGRAGATVIRVESGASPVVCDYRVLSPEDWRNVVRASMNDVDERCDYYIETLDNARRDRDMYRRQIQDTQTTTSAILGLNAGALADLTRKNIAMIGVAFGFTKNSLDNYYSRLILEVEKSSLRSLLKKRQTSYRGRLEKDFMQYITNKSAAYYAMRGYLRLCTPTSIEAEIKATVAGIKYTGEKRENSGGEADPDLVSLAALPR